MVDVKLRPSQIHKFRGYIGNLFKDHDIIHNHDYQTGKSIYRYPLIQFKLINNEPVIIAITEKAIRMFSEIFMTLQKIVIEDLTIPVHEKALEVVEEDFGYSEESFVYRFNSPWIGLNQTNYRKYLELSDQSEKEKLLTRTMTGNLLSISKYLDYWLDKEQKIKIKVQLKETTVNLKSNPMIGFTGVFKTNFNIPDYLGIGKSVSRGYGAIRKVL